MSINTEKAEAYAAGAKAAWGSTPAYREYEQKAKDRSKETEAELAGRMMDIFAELGAVKETDPASGPAQALVEKLRSFLSEHYYTCTKEILGGLGQAYVSNEEFARNIDSAGGNGTAAFVAAAITAYCRKAAR